MLREAWSALGVSVVVVEAVVKSEAAVGGYPAGAAPPPPPPAQTDARRAHPGRVAGFTVLREAWAR